MMVQTVIPIVMMMALVSGASTLNWKQCEPLSTKINSVRVPDCDPTHSTADRCALKEMDYHYVDVDYEQPKPIKVPNIRTQFAAKVWTEVIGCYEGLSCPGKSGQEQHLSRRAFFGTPSDGINEINLRLSVRENTTTVERADLCVEIPILLIS